MAIDLDTEYTDATAGDASYPGGSFKNEVTPGVSADGTPLEKAWQNDWLGFFQKVIAAAGITVSGAPDTIVASDYMDGALGIFGPNIFYGDIGTANTYQVSVASAQSVTVDALLDGMLVVFIANASNTGASTLQISGLTAKDITYITGVALEWGEIKKGKLCICRYDSSSDDFFLLNPVSIRIDTVANGTSGSTAEVDLTSYDVPQSDHQLHSGFKVYATILKTGTGGTQSIRFYWDTIVYDWALTDTTQGHAYIEITVNYVIGGGTNQNVTAKYEKVDSGAPAVIVTDHYLERNVAANNLTTSGYTAKFTGECSSAADNIIMQDFRIEFF